MFFNVLLASVKLNQINPLLSYLSHDFFIFNSRREVNEVLLPKLLDFLIDSLMGGRVVFLPYDI